MAEWIAHRGWSGQAPENTLSAIKRALEEPRISAIEIDVHLTKDGVPVVIHDYRVNRTTDGEGFVKDFTTSKLQALDAGSWFDPSFAGEKVPTLEQVLEMVACRKPLLIELKQAAGRYEGLEESVIQLIRKHGAEQHCQLISFDHQSLLACKAIDEKISRTLVFAGAPLLMAEQVKQAGASAVSINHPYINAEMVESLKKNETRLIVWTIDDKADADRVAGISGDIGITTNFPERLWT